MSLLLTSLGLAILINVIMFIPAYFFRTDVLTDLSYGLTFIVLAFLILILNSFAIGKLILFIMVLVWGLRLALFLFKRIRKIKKDSRFDRIRGSFFKFLGFWLLQGFTVWIILIPTLIYLDADYVSVSVASLMGFFIWISGLLVEAVADNQKFAFKNNPKNKGKWIESGLWRYSRHPNYFGEMLCWIGIYFYTLPVLSLSVLHTLIGLVSPLYIIFILRFVTGVPKLEKGADAKYGKYKGYRDYKKRTSMIILWPNRKNRKK